MNLCEALPWYSFKVFLFSSTNNTSTKGKQFRLLAWILGQLFHTLSVSPEATQSLKVSDSQLLTENYNNSVLHTSFVKCSETAVTAYINTYDMIIRQGVLTV